MDPSGGIPAPGLDPDDWWVFGIDGGVTPSDCGVLMA
jgi:hypothetical protein